MDVDSKYSSYFTHTQYICEISTNILYMYSSNIELAHNLNNALTVLGNTRYSKVSTKVNANTKSFDTCIFQFPYWRPTDYFVDKWHDHYMDI